MLIIINKRNYSVWEIAEKDCFNAANLLSPSYFLKTKFYNLFSPAIDFLKYYKLMFIVVFIIAAFVIAISFIIYYK